MAIIRQDHFYLSMINVHSLYEHGPENPPPLLNKNHNPQWCHILQIYKSFSKELFHVHNMTDSPALAQVPLNLGSNFHNYGKGVHAHHNYLLSLSAENAQLKKFF